MRRKRGRKKERRTIFILLAVFLLAAGGVAWVALRGEQGPLLPPEDPAVLAMRASPENAFNMLKEAVALAPPKPQDKKYPVDGEPGKMEFYETEPDSIARLLDMWAPDDSEAVRNHLEALNPTFEKVREALDAPFFLVPLCDENEWEGPYDNSGRLRGLGAKLNARALYALRIEGDCARAWDYLFLGARLGSRLQEDGPSSSLWYGPWILRAVVTHTRELVRECDEAGRLREVARGLVSVSHLSRDPRRSLEESMRRLDQQGRQIRQGKISYGNPLQNVLGRLMLRRQAVFLKAHRASLEEMVDLPYHEYREWLKEHPKLAEYISDDRDYILGNHIMWELDSTMQDNARTDAEIRAAALEIALVGHQREHGAFPKSLDALVPAYFDEMPVDPFSGGPFVYRTEGGDYMLYSVGGNGVDDDGLDKRRGDIVYHKPLGEVLKQ